MWSGPDSVSTELMCTLTGPLTQPCGASSELSGAVSSISTKRLVTELVLPTESTAQ